MTQELLGKLKAHATARAAAPAGETPNTSAAVAALAEIVVDAGGATAKELFGSTPPTAAPPADPALPLADSETRLGVNESTINQAASGETGRPPRGGDRDV